MSILQKICCFFLFGKMLLYLCPDKKYEAYYSLLLQWTMFAIIFLPLLAGGLGEQKLQEAQEMWEAWQQETANLQQDNMSREAEEMLQEAARQYAQEHPEEIERETESLQDGTQQKDEQEKQDHYETSERKWNRGKQGQTQESGESKS